MKNEPKEFYKKTPEYHPQPCKLINKDDPSLNEILNSLKRYRRKEDINITNARTSSVPKQYRKLRSNNTSVDPSFRMPSSDKSQRVSIQKNNTHANELCFVSNSFHKIYQKESNSSDKPDIPICAVNDLFRANRLLKLSKAYNQPLLSKPRFEKRQFRNRSNEGVYIKCLNNFKHKVNPNSFLNQDIGKQKGNSIMEEIKIKKINKSSDKSFLDVDKSKKWVTMKKEPLNDNKAIQTLCNKPDSVEEMHFQFVAFYQRVKIMFKNLESKNDSKKQSKDKTIISIKEDDDD